MDWPRGPGTAPESVSLYDYLEKKLGIQVRQSDEPMAAIFVESVEEAPSANAANLRDTIPGPPPEFEAVTVKPSIGDGGRNDFSYRNGRFLFQRITAKSIIAFGYAVRQDRVLGGPAWISSDLFDLVAKTDPDLAIAEVRPMVQELLAHHFHLSAHTEERPIPVYGLTAAKGLHLTGETSARGGCRMSANCRPARLHLRQHINCGACRAAQQCRR